LKVNKEEAHSILEDGQRSAPNLPPPPPVEKLAPIRSQKVASRNDLVSVKYMDGSIKRDVKYKKIEEDLKNNRCVLLEG
jgi:preprotein translocase subunit SecA